jgi:hypothetical protein
MWLVNSLFAMVLLSLFLSMLSSPPGTAAKAAVKRKHERTPIQPERPRQVG